MKIEKNTQVVLTLTDEDIIVGLGLLVAERPDFVYETPEDGIRCVYAYDGAPSCGVGQFFNRIGVPIEALEDETVVHKSVGDLAETNGPLRLNCTSAGKGMLARFQSAQDAGKPWSVAYLKALEAYADEKDLLR